MALVASLLGTQTFNTTTGTHTVVATPAVGDLIVLVVANTGYTGTTLPTDNNADGLGTYTLVNSCVKAASADTMQVYVRNAKIGNASSTTFSAAGASSTGGGLGVFKVTGAGTAGTTAIRQSAIQSNQSSGGTPTPVMGQAVKTGNAVIGAVFNASNVATLTPRGSPAYSEAFDTGYNTPTTGIEAMFISSGETGTSIAWGGTSGSAFCSIAVEIQSLFLQTLTETVTTSDTLAKRTSRLLSETVTTTATLLKRATKLLAETVTPTSSLATQRFKLKTLTETVTTTATLIKQATKKLTETITTTASLAKRTTVLLTETVTATATLLKKTIKLLAEIVTPTATLKRTTGVKLTEIITTTATLLRQTTKLLREIVTLTATLVRRAGKLLAEIITTAATLTRRTSLPLAETVTVTATLLRKTTVLLVEIITATATLKRTTGKLLAEIVTATASLTRRTGKLLSEILTATATIKRTTAKLLSETVTPTATLTRRASKLLAEVVSVVQTFANLHIVNIPLLETITVTSSLRVGNFYRQLMTETIAVVETFYVYVLPRLKVIVLTALYPVTAVIKLGRMAAILLLPDRSAVLRAAEKDATLTDATIVDADVKLKL